MNFQKRFKYSQFLFSIIIIQCFLNGTLRVKKKLFKFLK